MADPGNLIIFGASTRAAAFSALRANLRPLCADLFADADLQARCPALPLPGRYPEAFLGCIDAEVAGPWMYTGALENHSDIVDRMARRRPLWGNDGAVLLRARSPDVIGAAAKAVGLPAPAVRAFVRRPPAGRWLVKAWGRRQEAIHFWNEADAGDRPSSSVYLQEFIEGESQAAIFCAEGGRARLLGISRQLVGEEFLHARPFCYCGSVGPIHCDLKQVRALEWFGSELTSQCGLRGLFGVDGISCAGSFWPVEVNPRYTASIEVLEYALGLSAIAWHRAAFVPSILPPVPAGGRGFYVGKAVLFAQSDLTFPHEGPWSDVLLRPPSLSEPPRFADIPHPGTAVKAGWPILTFFAQGAGIGACLDELRRIAAGLDQLL